MRKRDDKPAALDHALYEIEMLVFSVSALSRPNLLQADGSGWLEVFAIHARNLNEFFSPKDPGGGCMRPDDFVAWKYSYSFDRDLARRASAQIAHLTFDRERPEEKTAWPFEKHFTALRVPALQFLEAVKHVEEFMAYHHNRRRTTLLLEVLPRVRFESVEQQANIAYQNA